MFNLKKIYFLLCIFVANTFSQGIVINTKNYNKRFRSIDICEKEYTLIPPFAVSQKTVKNPSSFQKVYAKNSLIENKTTAFLPNGSIVRMEPGEVEELSEVLKKKILEQENFDYLKALSDKLLPVEVVKSNTMLTQQLSIQESIGKKRINFKNIIKNDLNILKKGQKGYIHALALDIFKEKKNKFVLSKNAPDFFAKDTLLNDKLITLKAKKDPADGVNKYQASKCCFYKKGSNICHYKDYQFQAEDIQTGKKFSFTYKKVETCCGDDLFAFLRSVPAENSDEFVQAHFLLLHDDNYREINTGPINNLLVTKELSKLEKKTSDENSSHSFMKLPLFHNLVFREPGVKYDRTVYEAPFNSYHYNPSGASDESNDEWGKAVSMCAFLQTLKSWQDTCKGANCSVGIGHIYHPTDLKVHQTHGSGECFDVRPFTDNPDHKYHRVSYKQRRYSHKKTLKFIKLLRRSGARNIYFNDPKIHKKFYYVRKSKGHDNHIHFCYPVESDKVYTTCFNGIDED